MVGIPSLERKESLIKHSGQTLLGLAAFYLNHRVNPYFKEYLTTHITHVLNIDTYLNDQDLSL